jgi:Xaa-Pro dipeptidase
MDLLPKSEVVPRLVRLQQWMQDHSLDAVFVFQDADLFYFAGTVQAGMLCLPAQGEPLYLVQKSVNRARMESPWQRLVPFPGFKKLPGWLADEGLGNLSRIGIETDVLPTNYYLRLREAFPQADFVDASEGIRHIRMIKSAYEIEQIRQAAGMLRATFERIPSWIQPGVTELELTARIEGHLRSQGHQGIIRMRAFNHRIGYGTLSSGASAAYPTSFPGPVGFVGLYPAVPNGGSERRLAAGEPVMADFVGGYGGYIADKTRVFVLGEPGREMAEAHRFALDLNREIESMLKPGTLCSSIYQHALERVKDSPYASGFMGAADSQVRFVGHGVGLELDELPVLAGGFDIPLASGMTIAIEPKIIFTERGGVGIENTYRVTDTGFEKLTVFPEEIIAVPV